MAYKQHLEAFVTLGTLFNRFSESDTIENDEWLKLLEKCLEKAEILNPWFTKANLLFAIQYWGGQLNEKKIQLWQANYKEDTNYKEKKVAIIMAGNIPLVGFHDMLSVLMAGHSVIIKLSSNDTHLLPFIKKFLAHQDDSLEGKIEFTTENLKGFDAVIATGSNNTSRYFEYYFGKYPNIIRKNRNSVAVLTGNESIAQLEGLGEDIFRYFGLGCRSVSKLFVPKDYDFDVFFTTIFKWKHVLEHHKYVNNYDYNKAVYLMSEIKILDNGFLILKEDTGFASPIATLFFEYYSEQEALKERLQKEEENIQCIVSNGFTENEVPFGRTQNPVLSDYADGVDTMQFLKALK